MLNGRVVVMMSFIATRMHFYSASLNNDTSLSEITQTQYAVTETMDRDSVPGNCRHIGNRLTEKIKVALHWQEGKDTISLNQLFVGTSSH